MGFLKALGASMLGYVVVLLAMLLVPVLVLLCLWTGLCMFAALFMFLFWLFFSHHAHTLYNALYMAAWGWPPCLAAGVLGYYGDQLRARRRASLVTLRGDAPFR
jgi:hypothetical protein